MRNLFIIILLSLSTTAFSQYYVKEIGVRGGYTAGITFRVNLDEDLSYEGQVGYRDQGTVLSIIRQKHQEVAMDRLGNWEFLYGFGAHAGFYFTDSYRILFRQIYFGRDVFTPVIGFNGYLGIEYKMVDAPVSFGFCYQPFMEISLKQLFGINLWDFGINVKYRF
jgi:hypothetical protein